MSFSSPGGDGTVRGRFELSAEQPIRQLHSIRDAGAEADQSLRALGGTLDRLPERAAASWGSMHQVINREAGNISRRIDELEGKLDRFSRKSATARIELSGVAQANADLSELEARLDRFSHKRATAHAGVSGGGGFSSLAGGGGGAGGAGGGLFSTLGGIPGKLPWWAMLAPLAPSLLGGAGALVGSAGSAALGAGAVGIAGAGAALAGGIPSALVGKSAVQGLQGVTKAQTAYNTALQEFGRQSSQAQTAKRKLDQVMAQAPPGAAGAARQVAGLTGALRSGLAPAYRSVYGGIAQGAASIRQALPGVLPGVNASVGATSRSAAAFVGTATNSISIRQYGQLMSEFRQDLPFVEGALANVFRIMLNLATAGRPFFHEGVMWIDRWTTGLRQSSGDTVRVQGRMQGMVNSAKDWARLLGAGGRVLRDIFSQGVPAGDSMVVELTHTLDRWDTWLRDNPQKVRGFFSQAGRDVSGIAGAVANIARDLWQVLSALHPIIAGFSTLAGLVSGLGPGGVAGVGALLYGGVNALRSRGVAAPGVGSMAGSLVLGSGAPMVASARRARMAGGAVVPAAGEVPVTGPDGGTYLMPRSGFQTQVPASAIGDQLPLFAAGAAGYAFRGGRAAPSLSRGRVAFDQAFGGTAAETRFALPELVGQRAYGLSRLAAARPVVSSAARFAAPIIGITALLQGLQAATSAGGGVTHGIGAGLSTAASTLTLGTVHPDTFQHLFHGAFGTDQAGASLGAQAGRLQGLSAQAQAVQTPGQLHALERTMRANVPISFEMSPGEGAKFRRTLSQLTSSAAKQAGDVGASQWTDALSRGINRMGPNRAIRTALKGVNAEIRGLGPTGARQWAGDMAQWAEEQSRSNPKLRKPMKRLMDEIVLDVNRAKGTIHGHFKDIRDSVYFFNGQILDGSTKTWRAIGGALTDPSQVAMEKLSGIWGQIQSEAIDALTSMGYTKGQARSLVTGLSHGTIKASDVSSTAAAARAGLSPSHLTSVANRNQAGNAGHARGGVIRGQGLLDTVPMPDGSMAAPGEAVIANRHTMAELDLAALRMFGKTAWQMVRDEDRMHSAPASPTLRNRALNYNRHARGGGGGGQHSAAPSNAALNSGVATPSSQGTSGYVYPFPGLSPGRLDQGYDLSGSGPLYALGSGTVIESGLWPGWPGTGGVVYRLDSGPNAGSNVYYMEHVQSRVSVGQHVTAGQPIATLLSGSPYLEAGWANASGTGPLTPYNGAADGTPMPGGINFRNFVNALLSGGKLPPGISGTGGAAPTPISIRAPRTGLKGIPGALGDRASQMMAKGLQDKVNAKTGATGGGLMGPGGGATVTASVFGGPGDPGTGSTGYRGDNLYQHPDSFAELNMGTALGNLPYMQGIRVTHGGHSKVLYKRDIGAGGKGLNGTPRAIDVWFQSAGALGIGGLDQVQWQRAARGGRIAWGGWNARGGDYVTHGPTMFGAGEKGKEHVSISPVRSGGGAGGRQIVVNITGPVSFSGTPQELDATARYVAGKILDALDHVGESGTHDAKLMGAAA